MNARVGSALVLACAVGCSAARSPSTEPPRATPVAHTIYRGAVFAPDGRQLFRYTRSAEQHGDSQTSSHITHDVRDQEPLVVQHAKHSLDYALQSFHEVHVPRGIQSTGTVLEGGRLHIETRSRGRTRTRTERHAEPFVVGPTLFGFVAAHWEPLVAGEVVDVRFVVTDRGRSYPFRLRHERTTEGHTTISMTARSLFVRMSVPPMRMTFETASRRIVRYEGRIPPQHEGKAVDARVEYEHVAARYR